MEQLFTDLGSLLHSENIFRVTEINQSILQSMFVVLNDLHCSLVSGSNLYHIFFTDVHRYLVFIKYSYMPGDISSSDNVSAMCLT